MNRKSRKQKLLRLFWNAHVRNLTFTYLARVVLASGTTLSQIEQVVGTKHTCSNPVTLRRFEGVGDHGHRKAWTHVRQNPSENTIKKKIQTTHTRERFKLSKGAMLASAQSECVCLVCSSQVGPLWMKHIVHHPLGKQQIRTCATRPQQYCSPASDLNNHVGVVRDSSWIPRLFTSPRL